jgi:di-heme oxidoreductase (putative peroxidase)
VPAEKPRTPQRRHGHELFGSLGCARCHVPDWHLETDRRFFDLQVTPNPETGRLEGRVVKLDREHPKPFTIRGVYSDFVHHDLGPAFHQVQFDGSQVTRFRTAPLWGVSSTAPYGHDGASLDLDDVIRRHGGEAEAEQKAYAALPDEDRAALLEFLRGLVLYSVDDLPCDVDGDGRIAEHFMVAGQDTGVERLNPEWLFRVPGRIEGDVRAPDGTTVRSFALTNVEEAYGAHLEWLEDADHDGWPDARVPPVRTGGPRRPR